MGRSLEVRRKSANLPAVGCAFVETAFCSLLQNGASGVLAIRNMVQFCDLSELARIRNKMGRCRVWVSDR